LAYLLLFLLKHAYAITYQALKALIKTTLDAIFNGVVIQENWKEDRINVNSDAS